MPAAGCFRDFVMREFDRFSGAERLSGGRRQSCGFKFRKAGIEHGFDAAKEFDEAFGASRAEARSQGESEPRNLAGRGGGYWDLRVNGGIGHGTSCPDLVRSGQASRLSHARYRRM